MACSNCCGCPTSGVCQNNVDEGNSAPCTATNDCDDWFRTITASGFTGTAAIFNGTWTLGFDPHRGSVTGNAAWWSLDAFIAGTHILITLQEFCSNPTTGPLGSDLQFLIGSSCSTLIADYTATAVGCTTTYNLSSCSAGSGCPATVQGGTVATQYLIPATCDCASEGPKIPRVLHLTISGSNVTNAPNGVYPLTYQDNGPANCALEHTNGWYGLISGGTHFVFYLDYDVDDANCSDRCGLYGCDPTGLADDFINVSGCFCNPISASGVITIGGNTCGNTAGQSFNWSVAE